MQAKTIAFVIQRFGKDIVGGSEALARSVALRLHKDLGVQIEVLTSAATDYRTWANDLAPGESCDEGITVRRFAARGQRSRYFGLYERLTSRLIIRMQKIDFLKPLAQRLGTLWFRLQGPYCPELIAYLVTHQHRYQKVVFFTYLYYPTLEGLHAIALTLKSQPEKAILVPTAHDEPAFYFDKVAHAMRIPQHLLVNSIDEGRLIERIYPDRAGSIQLVGVGIDPLVDVSRMNPPEFALQKPFFLYLGRISKGKGVDTLIAWFCEWQKRSGLDAYKLVLAGKRDDVIIPDHPAIEFCGFVDSTMKSWLLHHATAVINPSPLESLSLIVLEAMKALTPVLVNGKCQVLQYYADHNETVRSFEDEASFYREMDRLCQTSWTDESNQVRLNQSCLWVEQQYGWPQILMKYQRLLETD